MANVLHKNLTSTDLHEPKGADAATANTTYVSDGAGSGSWFGLVPLGVVWDYWGATEPTGFLFADGQTIGNASSNGTARANADTSDLFDLLWTIGDTYGTLAIYTSAGAASTFGADAATDFAANKAIALPDYRERVSIGGDMQAAASRIDSSYVDAASVGATGGIDDLTLTEDYIPEHSHSSGSLSTNSTGSHSHSASTGSSGSHSHTYTRYSSQGNVAAGSGEPANRGGSTESTNTTGSHSHSVSVSSAGSHSHTISGDTGNYGTASPTAIEIIQPTIVCNKIIFYGA